MGATIADNLMKSWGTMRKHQVPVNTQTFADPHNIPAACCAVASTKRLRTSTKSTNTVLLAAVRLAGWRHTPLPMDHLVNPLRPKKKEMCSFGSQIQRQDFQYTVSTCCVMNIWKMEPLVAVVSKKFREPAHVI